MRTVVFITGTGHCGSTLLDMMLGSHSQGFSLGELHRLKPELMCRECEHCEFWERIPKSWVNLHFGKGRRIARFFSPYDRLFKVSGASLLVDSSKTTDWISRQLEPAYKWATSDHFLILLDRDPRAVVASYLRRYPERGFEKLVERVTKSRRNLRAFYEAHSGRKAMVSYEQLTEQPEATMRELCQAIGIDFEERMLRPFDHTHHIIAGNGNTRRLSGESGLIRGSGKEFYKERTIRPDDRWKAELTEAQISYIDSAA